MTEHEQGAAKFAEALGGIEGRERPLDKWEQRSHEQHDLYKRDVETKLAERAEAKRFNDRGYDIREEQWAAEKEDRARGVQIREENHAVWLAEVKHCQAHREREVAALEKIASVLDTARYKSLTEYLDSGK